MATSDAITVVTSTGAFITAMQTEATTAIDRLTDEATSWSMTTLGAIAALTLGNLTTYSGVKPALGTIASIPAFTASDFTGVTAPELPAAPSLAAYNQPVWNEAFWSNLKTKLAAFTDNITGGDDVDTVVTKLTTETSKLQVALYAAEYERKSQLLRDEYSAAEASTGAKGFTYPNSMTTALKLDAQQKFQFDLSQASRDLVKLIFEWAKTNYQFSMQQSVAAHVADTEFNVRYADTLLKGYATTVNALLDKYKTDILAVVQEADTKVKEYTAQAQIEIEETKTLKEIQLKDAGFDLDAVKTNAMIAEADYKVKITDYAERVKSFLATAEANMKILDDNAKNRIAAATAAIQGASAMASSSQQIAVGIVNG